MARKPHNKVDPAWFAPPVDTLQQRADVLPALHAALYGERSTGQEKGSCPKGGPQAD